MSHKVIYKWGSSELRWCFSERRLITELYTNEDAGQRYEVVWTAPGLIHHSTTEEDEVEAVGGGRSPALRGVVQLLGGEVSWSSLQPQFLGVTGCMKWLFTTSGTEIGVPQGTHAGPLKFTSSSFIILIHNFFFVFCFFLRLSSNSARKKRVMSGTEIFIPDMLLFFPLPHRSISSVQLCFLDTKIAHCCCTETLSHWASKSDCLWVQVYVWVCYRL